MGFNHSWNGTVLTVTSDSGTSSADLKGATGDTGIRGAQGAAGTVDYTVLENYLKKNVKDIQSTNIIQIQTRFNSFDGQGDARQSIFMFGLDNNIPTYGLIAVKDNGECSWSGTGDITVAAAENGVINVTLPITAYDVFTIISGQSASIL